MGQLLADDLEARTRLSSIFLFTFLRSPTHVAPLKSLDTPSRKILDWYFMIGCLKRNASRYSAMTHVKCLAILTLTGCSEKVAVGKRGQLTNFQNFFKLFSAQRLAVPSSCLKQSFVGSQHCTAESKSQSTSVSHAQLACPQTFVPSSHEPSFGVKKKKKKLFDERSNHCCTRSVFKKRA